MVLYFPQRWLSLRADGPRAHFVCTGDCQGRNSSSVPNMPPSAKRTFCFHPADWRHVRDGVEFRPWQSPVQTKMCTRTIGPQLNHRCGKYRTIISSLFHTAFSMRTLKGARARREQGGNMPSLITGGLRTTAESIAESGCGVDECSAVSMRRRFVCCGRVKVFRVKTTPLSLK